MSIRAQLQNTKLSQRVADFVKCMIRGDIYDTSNLNILVQVTSTNPFEISDLHNYIQIKDPQVFLDKIKETNDNLTVQSAQGSFFFLSKWHFVADMDSNSNKLKFDMVVEEVMFYGGQHTIEHPENPTPLFETAQVRSQLNRLKKYFIAQRFNQENPFDPTPIEEARYAISESIRKQSNVPRDFPEPSQLQDPFLIYNPPNDGKASVSHSQVDDYEELSINSQTQRRIGDVFRNKDLYKKPYSTMPSEAFGLNLDNLSNQPLIGATPIPEAPEREEGSATNPEQLPTFGGDHGFDQNKEPEVGTDKIESEGTRKRNFDSFSAEHPESTVVHVQQTTKIIKQTWGPDHYNNQNKFKNYRDEKRALESKKSDPLELLGMSESQEALEFASHHIRHEKKDEIHRPPETKFSKPLFEEDIEIEEEINKEKPKPQQAQYKIHSPVKIEKPKSNQQNSNNSKKSWSFGPSGGARAEDEEIEIIKHDKAQQLRQSTISDFNIKIKPYINKPTVVQQAPVHHHISNQTINTNQYVTKELKYPPQQGSNKKPVYKEQSVQIQSRKPQHDIYEIDDTNYLKSFIDVKKPSPADKIFQSGQKPRFESNPVRRESGVHMDYLRTFTDLSVPKKSPYTKMIIENPIKPGSQIDLTDFVPVSAKKQHVNSSSTVIQRSPKVPSVQASPAKFSENDYLYMKRLYDMEVRK